MFRQEMRCSLRVRPYIPSYALPVVVFWRCRNKEPHSSGFLCRVVLSGTKSNNFRWLNAVKETKIEFFARDNSGEKNFSLPTQLGEIFSEVICPRLRGCRPFVVISPAWKVLRFGSENFSHPPSPVRASLLVGRYGRFAEACFDFGFSWLHVQVFPISW